MTCPARRADEHEVVERGQLAVRRARRRARAGGAPRSRRARRGRARRSSRSAVTAVSAPRLPHATPSTGRLHAARRRAARRAWCRRRRARSRGRTRRPRRAGATSCSWPGRAQLDELGALALRPLAHGRERVAELAPRVHDEPDAVERVGVHGQRRYRRAPPCASPSTPRPPDLPADLARDRGRRRRGAARARVGRRHALLRRAGRVARAARARGRDPAGRPRALPVLLRARRALRRRPATTRSRSTTSGAPPGSARAARTSSTCRTCSRRGRRPCRPTPRRRSPRCASAPARAAASTVGFCFGGTQSFLAATNAELGLDGVVGFYGGLSPERWGDMSPIHRAREMRGPVLGLFGGADEGIPPEQVEAFERPRRGRRRARDRHLPGRAALVLRPPLRGARARRAPTPGAACSASWRNPQP